MQPGNFKVNIHWDDPEVIKDISRVWSDGERNYSDNSSILITGCTHSRSHAEGWLSGSCVGVSGNASLPRGVGSLHCRMAETVG